MEQKTVSGIVFAAASAEMALGRRVFQGPTAGCGGLFRSAASEPVGPLSPPSRKVFVHAPRTRPGTSPSSPHCQRTSGSFGMNYRGYRLATTQNRHVSVITIYPPGSKEPLQEFIVAAWFEPVAYVLARARALVDDQLAKQPREGDCGRRSASSAMRR